jgi:hypothetical protein
MIDVLIREKLWDVVSGEKARPADPDFLESDTSTDAGRTQAQGEGGTYECPEVYCALKFTEGICENGIGAKQSPEST